MWRDIKRLAGKSSFHTISQLKSDWNTCEKIPSLKLTRPGSKEVGHFSVFSGQKIKSANFLPTAVEDGVCTPSRRTYGYLWPENSISEAHPARKRESWSFFSKFWSINEIGQFYYTNQKIPAPKLFRPGSPELVIFQYFLVKKLNRPILY